MARSPVAGLYDMPVDRESAFEVLAARTRQRTDPADPHTGPVPEKRRERDEPAPRRSNRQSYTEAVIKSMARSAASSLGRALVRGILGGLSRGLR
jgi:hypothetical protein